MRVFYGYHEGTLVVEASVYDRPEHTIFLHYPNSQCPAAQDFISYGRDPVIAMNEFIKINIQWKEMKLETEIKKHFIEILKAIVKEIDEHKEEIKFEYDPNGSKLVLCTLHNYITSIIEKEEK
jgi:hypothetical protein